MYLVSSNTDPSYCVLRTRSKPARSSSCNLLLRTRPVPIHMFSSTIENTQCDREAWGGVRIRREERRGGKNRTYSTTHTHNNAHRLCLDFEKGHSSDKCKHVFTARPSWLISLTKTTNHCPLSTIHCSYQASSQRLNTLLQLCHDHITFA